MSRMIPPTPVAAPWYGSMNDGMVVGFDLEDGGQPVADVDGAGVLAGTLQHLRPFGRQRSQVDARALVAAVLGPHHREDAELGQVRLATEERRRCGRTRRASARAGREPGDPSSCPPATALPIDRLHDRLENHHAVGAAEQRLARAFRMRHQSRRRYARSLQRPAMAPPIRSGSAVVAPTRPPAGDRCSGRSPDGSPRAAASTSGSAK